MEWWCFSSHNESKLSLCLVMKYVSSTQIVHLDVPNWSLFLLPSRFTSGLNFFLKFKILIILFRWHSLMTAEVICLQIKSMTNQYNWRKFESCLILSVFCLDHYPLLNPQILIEEDATNLSLNIPSEDCRMDHCLTRSKASWSNG